MPPSRPRTRIAGPSRLVFFSSRTGLSRKRKFITGAVIFPNRLQERRNGIRRIQQKTLDVLKPLAFPQEAFDFVNTRFISPFMPKDAWPRLLQECVRITLPGGVIRLTDGEWSFSNGKATEQFADMVIRAMWLAGKSFSPDGKRFGTTLILSQFLREAGLGNIQHQAYALDYSYGTEAHETMYQNCVIAFKLVQPFLVKMGVVSQEEADQKYQQMLIEMMMKDFYALWYYLTVWGRKPQ